MRTMLTACMLLVITAATTWAGPYAPPAGQSGSTAIAATDPTIVAWASGFQNLVRGPLDIANPGGGLASAGSGTLALGPANGNPADIVSLGDGGHITLTFAAPITDEPGFDFAVFENSFSDSFLELAFVEVSTNGTDFLRFPAVSLTSTATQVGSFGSLDATNLDNLAGKYRGGFGTPFDLALLADMSPAVDVDHIGYVRIVDVVGSTNPMLGSFDSLGNLVNDPYPTAFASGGFDLDGVGALHVVPEPSAGTLACATLAALAYRRRRVRRSMQPGNVLFHGASRFRIRGANPRASRDGGECADAPANLLRLVAAVGAGGRLGRRVSADDACRRVSIARRDQ